MSEKVATEEQRFKESEKLINGLVGLRDASKSLRNGPSNKLFGSVNALVSQFNELLRQAKQRFTDDKRIARMRETQLAAVHDEPNALDLPNLQVKAEELEGSAQYLMTLSIAADALLWKKRHGGMSPIDQLRLDTAKMRAEIEGDKRIVRKTLPSGGESIIMKTGPYRYFDKDSGEKGTVEANIVASRPKLSVPDSHGRHVALEIRIRDLKIQPDHLRKRPTERESRDTERTSKVSRRKSAPK
ncbi:MAG: hypothetical protein ABSF63_00235 [Candidatus Bathyarchaeia archaeon]|jgi:hypothetical protein